ncbi:unnamed protein product, partial [Amoebophrya sp. A120]
RSCRSSWNKYSTKRQKSYKNLHFKPVRATEYHTRMTSSSTRRESPVRPRRSTSGARIYEQVGNMLTAILFIASWATAPCATSAAASASASRPAPPPLRVHLVP